MGTDAVLLVGWQEAYPRKENRRLRGQRYSDLTVPAGSAKGNRAAPDWSFCAASVLEELLSKSGRHTEVYWSVRQGTPSLESALDQIVEDGHQSVSCVILAPLGNMFLWRQTIDHVHAVVRRKQYLQLKICFCEPWHDHPLFHESLALRLKPYADEKDAVWLFTAPSILENSAEKLTYGLQISLAARSVAERYEHSNWDVAYLFPQDEWLRAQHWAGPGLEGKICEWASLGKRKIVTVPLGFIGCVGDAFDPQWQRAKTLAKKCALQFHQVERVEEHTRFLEMLADLTRKSPN